MRNGQCSRDRSGGSCRHRGNWRWRPGRLRFCFRFQRRACRTLLLHPARDEQRTSHGQGFDIVDLVNAQDLRNQPFGSLIRQAETHHKNLEDVISRLHRIAEVISLHSSAAPGRLDSAAGSCSLRSWLLFGRFGGGSRLLPVKLLQVDLELRRRRVQLLRQPEESQKQHGRALF